jgi:protein TonB
MRGWGIAVAAVLHAGIALLALNMSERQAKHRATSVAVVGTEKKKSEKKDKKEEKPKPKRKVVSTPPRAEPHATPTVAPKLEAPPPVTAPAAAAPVDTGLQLGNDDGPGIAIGGGAGVPRTETTPATAPRPATTPAGPRPVARPKAKVLGAQMGDGADEDEACNEAPTKPTPIQRSEIEYTQEARAAGVEGRLVLRITVAADGSVEKVDVVSSVDPSLDAAAVAIVKTWSFKPAMRCGKPIAGGVYTIAQRFELGD